MLFFLHHSIFVLTSYPNREPDGKYEDHSYTALVDDFMDAVVENWREPANFGQAAYEELYQKQTKQFAELALKRYNKNNKVDLFNVISASVISSIKAVRLLVNG